MACSPPLPGAPLILLAGRLLATPVEGLVTRDPRPVRSDVTANGGDRAGRPIHRSADAPPRRRPPPPSPPPQRSAEPVTDRMDELKGAAKKTVGEATGDEGREAEGQAEQTAAKAARETKGAANQAAGGVKAKVGDALDDERLQTEGEAQRAEGKSQSAG